MKPCVICDNTGWVCEGHGNHPWRGLSNRPDSCDFGPGIPCPSSTCEHSLARRDGDDNATLRAENDRLRAALRGLLECPHIADRGIDPAWSEPETERAVEAARAALDGQPAPTKEQFND